MENAYRLYLYESREAAYDVLFGGFPALVFWGGLLAAGSVIPAVILFNPRTGSSIPWIVLSSVLVVFGVLCERYLIVIPGQAHAPDLFPNMEIPRSVVEEGMVSYSISYHEWFQALGVVALVGFLFVLGLRLFKLLPKEARIYEQPTPAQLPVAGNMIEV
ncbi:MAG: hypothetical protein A2V98_01820 [Planctomycetes bacterium RBG_16_64_12]|nr:MAG: hypothetical protein A2V98_01820 [Planctomycetes bacterium RBG_16_64_12]